jgi:membrane-associated phospholipid phosphatase
MSTFVKQPPVCSQGEVSASFKNDISIGLRTGYDVLTSPVKFTSDDWLWCGIGLAAAGGTIMADNNIRENFKHIHSPFLDKTADVGHSYGNAAYAIAFSGLIYTGGKVFGAEKYAVTGRILLEGLLYAGITSTIVKSIFGRSRPYTNDGPYRFNGFQLKTETTSFPSGHATVAFTISSVLAERFDNIYASLFLYSLAASTVFQRVYSDSHWASDTILGGLIGYSVGKAVAKYDKNNSAVSLSVTPYYMVNGSGFNFQYSF